ncbi:MAG TPA: DUF2721 domain-containing protein [Pseudorhodoferax sp.]|jgi:hypothetical protein|nr:DUF2721 domain-containing protein [Pseudorhodoferax sp.]
MLSIQADTAHVIQLAVGPAFMLAAIGGTLTVLTNRLARVNDRMHKCRDERETATPARSAEIDAELATLNRRAKILNAGVSTGALCGVVVCLLIGSLFVANELGLSFDRPVAVLFVVAMLALIATYALLLVEVFVTQRSINPT